MSTPLSLIAQGSFISTGAARVVELPVVPDYFEVFNSSTWGTAPTAVVKSFWYNGYAAGRASTITEGGASALSATAIAAAGLGFTIVDYRSLTDGPAIATTAITNANPAVVSTGTTPSIGDIVRIYNQTQMQQIAGMDFTITAVTPGVNMTLGYLNAAGFANPATNGFYRRIPADLTFYPRKRWITGITAANPCVLTVSVAHDFVAGEKITIHCPAAFGMTQIDSVTATITAVTASTITINIDSSAFTAFAFPTSAVAAAGVSFPHVVPAGEIATILTGATRNVGYIAMRLDTGVVGANTNVMYWRAFKADYAP